MGHLRVCFCYNFCQIDFEQSAIRVTSFAATVIEEQGILLSIHRVFPLNLSRSKIICYQWSINGAYRIAAFLNLYSLECSICFLRNPQGGLLVLLHCATQSSRDLLECLIQQYAFLLPSHLYQLLSSQVRSYTGRIAPEGSLSFTLYLLRSIAQVLQRTCNFTMAKPECKNNPQRRQSSMQQCCAKRAQEDKDQFKSITTLANTSTSISTWSITVVKDL